MIGSADMRIRPVTFPLLLPVHPSGFACLIAALALLSAPARAAELQQRLLDRLNELPRFQEFAALYPEARYVITNTSTEDSIRAEGRALFFGRYSLNVGVGFSVDPGSGDLLQEGPVDVTLREFKRFRREDGGIAVEFENEWTLDETQWAAISGDGGDIRALAMPLVTDRPVAFVDRYWEAM
jgi:hypothetical protein